MLSSRGSSQPRDQTCISCIAGEFFTIEPSGKHSDFSLLIPTTIIRQNEALRLSRLVPVRKPGINPQRSLGVADGKNRAVQRTSL